MSNDLISRKALMDEIEKSMNDNQHKDIFSRASHYSEHAHFLKMVSDQPVAYDVDAVCDAMKKSPTYHGPILDEDGFAEEVDPLILVDDAIGIVRNGVIANER